MQRGHIPGQEHISRKKQRIYHYLPATEKRRRQLLLCSILLGCVMVLSAWKLIDYAADYFSAQQASDQLRELYYEEEVTTPTPTAVPAPTATPAPTPTLEPDVTATPSPTPARQLQQLRYPDNPYAAVSSRFQKLRRQNGDIVGWLKIEGLVDEPVVQKDNTYYLRRDYRGYHNVNGALFLDENTDMLYRPYTLMIYGHNMKTGAMFGNLRNFEKLSFYQRNPFVTFDSIYEEGRYVIFSIAELSLNAKDRNYFSFSRLNSDNIAWRAEAISDLISHSVFYTEIDVQPEDQLLLMVTCVDDEDERRVVTARRVREGESEESLQRSVNRARKW